MKQENVLPYSLIAACLGACLGMMAGCSEEPSVDQSDGVFTSAWSSASEREFNEDGAKEAAQDVMGGETYEGRFGSSQCTDDCSGHEAGFEWARENSITDPGDCGSTDSQSFDEGCAALGEAIADEVQTMRDDFENGDDTYLVS